MQDPCSQNSTVVERSLSLDPEQNYFILLFYALRRENRPHMSRILNIVWGLKHGWNLPGVGERSIERAAIENKQLAMNRPTQINGNATTIYKKQTQNKHKVESES